MSDTLVSTCKPTVQLLTCPECRTAVQLPLLACSRVRARCFACSAVFSVDTPSATSKNITDENDGGEYYAVLGVGREASAAEVLIAFLPVFFDLL